ncbi:MAG TPA: glycoside hydrolase family 25 protein [Anaerovoracaceae bacterium]|nr:glycoside hydrolase family 25 protein [Anaerovoracaceae bacterium]
MFKKQLALYSAIILLIILIIVSYFYAKNNQDPPIYNHDARFENSIIVEGIDVSYYQGESIDWGSLKDEGIDFVMVRCAYRGSDTGDINIDENYLLNIREAQDNGIMVGAYIYSQAITKEEALEEANYLIELVKNEKITMPLTIDYEIYEDGRLDNAINSNTLDKNDITDICLAFCEQVENAGYESMVYGNRNFLITKHDTDRLANNTNIWMANYTKQTNYGGNYSIWQYTSKGLTSGINGNVDKNFWYIVDTSFEPLDETKRDISNCKLRLTDDSFLYLGRTVEPEVICLDNGNLLIENRDYYISYVNNSNPGIAHTIVSGIGNYSGKTILSFKINSLF